LERWSLARGSIWLRLALRVYSLGLALRVYSLGLALRVYSLGLALRVYSLGLALRVYSLGLALRVYSLGLALRVYSLVLFPVCSLLHCVVEDVTSQLLLAACSRASSTIMNYLPGTTG
jgi:hypothetical protein